MFYYKLGNDTHEIQEKRIRIWRYEYKIYSSRHSRKQEQFWKRGLMPIDPNFPENLHVLGKRNNSDGTHFYFIWGPGNTKEAASESKVNADYEKRGEPLVPLGVHGTTVAVDWDSCIADGGCIEICPVQVYQWYRTENDVPAVQMSSGASAGTGSVKREERKDFTDKSEPVREHDCIWCMACITVCPVSAIKVDQANLEFHKKAMESVM